MIPFILLIIIFAAAVYFFKKAAAARNQHSGLDYMDYFHENEKKGPGAR